MGLFSWLFGKRPPETVLLKGSDEYALEVVGESFHQATLEAMCGGRTKDGHQVVIVATLVYENDNPHDDQAIRVEIGGQPVGHLSRKLARAYRKALDSAGHSGKTARCSAMIVGGWDRGGDDQGYFGVKLDVSVDL